MSDGSPIHEEAVSDERWAHDVEELLALLTEHPQGAGANIVRLAATLGELHHAHTVGTPSDLATQLANTATPKAKETYAEIVEFAAGFRTRLGSNVVVKVLLTLGRLA